MNTDLSKISQPQPPVNGNGWLFAGQTVTVNKQEYVDLRWRANYWEKQHTKSVERIEVLRKEWETQHTRSVERIEVPRKEGEKKDAIIRDLKQRLYGKKSEKGGKASDANPNATPENKPKSSKGQQKGCPGHG